MSDDQAVKPPGDIGDGDGRAPMEPASVSRVDGQLVVRVPMSAQGYLPERGYHYIRDANYVAFSRENVLGGWDTASPGLRFDDNDQLAVATALLDTQGAVVKDTQGEECVVSGRMVRLMLTHAARTAIENDCHPRVKCGGRIVNICPLNLMLPHITDTDIVTVRKASVLFRNDGDADLWVPIVRFDAPAATVIMFCDRWMAQTAGTAQEPLITLFSVEAFVSANRTRGVSVPKPIEPDPHSVN